MAHREFALLRLCFYGMTRCWPSALACWQRKRSTMCTAANPSSNKNNIVAANIILTQFNSVKEFGSTISIKAHRQIQIYSKVSTSGSSIPISFPSQSHESKAKQFHASMAAQPLSVSSHAMMSRARRQQCRLQGSEDFPRNSPTAPKIRPWQRSQAPAGLTGRSRTLALRARRRRAAATINGPPKSVQGAGARSQWRAAVELFSDGIEIEEAAWAPG
jgi:hypothetical protein